MKSIWKMALYTIAAALLPLASCDILMAPLGGVPDREALGKNNTPISFTVTFNKNGGDTDASPASKTVTSPATTIDVLPAQPTKDGHSFNGWNTAANGSETVFTADTTVNKNLTVYAQWVVVTPDSFTVTFDKNGGDTDATPTQKIVTPPANKVDGLPTAPTRGGYIFGGWFTGQDGSGTEFTADTPVSAAITVYAKWMVISYTVTFDKNGGDTEVDPPTKTVTTPANKVDGLPTEPTRTGHIFGGWFTGQDGSGTEFTVGTTVSANITVYAKWVPSWTVTFDSNGGSAVNPKTVPRGSTVTRPDSTLNGYILENWYRELTYNNLWNFETYAVTADMTLYAKWIPAYTVTFNAGSGMLPPPPQTVGEGKKAAEPVITKIGHTLDGWYTEDGSPVKWNFENAVMKDMTLYARWNINQYTVTFYADGGTPDPTSPVTKDYDSNIDEPETMTKNGYTFGGWYTEGGFENKWNFASGTVSGHMGLYAQWIADGAATLTISFAQIADNAPSIEGPVLYKETQNPARMTFILDNPLQYSDIKWRVDNGAITGTGASFILDAANYAVSKHFVTVSVIKGGAPYSTTVPFMIEL